MAAPCGEFVRIRLYFENNSFERSWLLIVFKKLPFVSDVINEIRKRNDICRESRISLRLKDHVLPGIEASFILKEDDIVCVRVENSDSADNDIPIATNIEDTREKKKKRKRKHNESSEFVHGDITSPKELKQDKRVDESATADKTDKTPKKKPKLEDFQEPHDQNCFDVGIKAMGKKDNPMKKETPKASDDEANDSGQSVKKRKRIRKRKRKSKKPAVDESGNCHDEPAFGKDISHCYHGNEVKKEDTFYGKLPDKLENPKNYRKGYRNLKQYNALPNVHKTFDSDSEVEEENMEQYNFLSKANLSGGIHTADDQNVISSIVTSNNNSNNTQNDSVHNISANTEPWHYTNMNSRALHDNVQNTPDQHKKDNFMSQLTSPLESSTSPAGPTILTKVTLTSGASVFKRVRTPVRSKPVSKVWEMSKEEQINTIATNHSTIFKNSPATFSTSLKAETITPTRKVPDSPVTNLVQSGCNGQSVDPAGEAPSGGGDLQGILSGQSGVQDGLLEDLSDQVLSKLPPVVGMPDVGDKIAYKILEMSANCTPEVSEYKVGEVTRVDAGQMLEIHNITQQTDVVPNKFHVEMEYEDEVLTNSAPPPDVAYLHLSSLLDPRLVHKAEQA